MPEGLVIGGGGSNENPSTISGDGSQAHPYEITSVEDLRETITTIRAKDTAGTYYAVLVNDLDGAWEEWSRIQSSSANGRYIDLDFNNHCIMQYTLTSSYSTCGLLHLDAGDILRNGAIYNIYADTLVSEILDNVETVKMSISAKCKESEVRPFARMKFTNTALWCDIDEYLPNGLSSDLQYIVGLRAPASIAPEDARVCEESDFYIHIKNLNVSKFWVFKSTSGLVTPKDSRLRGGIDNITLDEIIEYPYISDSNVGFIDSVINFEMSAYSGTVSSGEASTIIGTGTTGVINTELIHEQTYAEYTMLNLIEVTNAQMHNAEALTTAGFPVYDITP